MTLACRKLLGNVLNCQQLAHAGLLLAKYLKNQDDANASKNDLLKKAKTAFDEQLYEKVFHRWKEITSSDFQRSFEVDGRMIVGLGASNVLETGITLHHTYGVPYIPGSSLKGLCSHYCDEVFGKQFDESFKRDKILHTMIFGNQNSAGCVDFHDAWIVPGSLQGCLHLDVMTPHHTDYYEKGAAAPTDFDDPNPVSFLSVTGKFLVVLSCRENTEHAKTLVNLVWKILRLALRYEGIGGKTAGGYGYGRLLPLPTPPQPAREPLAKGTLKKLTRLTKKEAEALKKKILFRDDEGNPCIVPSKIEDEVKKLAPNPNDTVVLEYDSEQKQGDQVFLMFRLPIQNTAN